MLEKIPGIKVHNYIYKNRGDLTFSDQSKSWGLSAPGFSNGAAYADLDNDGDLDLILNNIDEPATLYKNSTNASANKASNFLKVNFEGARLNREGLGAKIYLKYHGNLQYQYFTPVRGFLSSVEPGLHFGLGDTNSIDSLEVIWPDGHYQLLKDVKANQDLTLKYSSAGPAIQKEAKAPASPLLFTEVARRIGIDYTHKENEYVDFKVQPLLPHMHSKNGPGIAVSDVNADGLEDFYIGGASNHSGALYLQQGNGKFKKGTTTGIDSVADDMGVLFFDAEGDGDVDLYVASGGSEHVKGSDLYKDELYMNDGKGNFRKVMDALPEVRQSGSSVVAADYDRDGDLDLFVGGRIVPGEYPLPADSYLFRNDSDKTGCRFTNVTEAVAPGFIKLGLVTSALWTDVDNDGWIDLMIVGEFMPITCYKNNEGKTFTPLAKESLGHTSGWWNSLTGGDFDNDGDTDYIAGNLGLNTRYRGNRKEPLCIYANDYDKSGNIDPVMTMYSEGVQQIVHAWDDMVKQMNPIRSRFRTYLPYAETAFEDSFTKAELESAYVVCGEWFETSYIENVGQGNFSIKVMPVNAQFSPVFGTLPGDFDGDGNLDVLMIGNSYATEVSTGRYDACIGLYFRGDGKGNFASVPVQKSGFFADKDGKGLSKLILKDGHQMILVGNNNDTLTAHRVNTPKKYFFADNKDSYAIVKLKNGNTYKHEFYFGSTYLSQSSRSMELSDSISNVEVYNFLGQKKPWKNGTSGH